MSLNDWSSWNDRKTRTRERLVEEVFVPEAPPAPIEVQEDPLSETGVVRFLRRIAGRDRP